jgi:hypothetical protein
MGFKHFVVDCLTPSDESRRLISNGLDGMEKKLKSDEQFENANAALQHAVLSLVLLGVIMGSLIQITHMLIDNHESLSVVALSLNH